MDTVEKIENHLKEHVSENTTTCTDSKNAEKHKMDEYISEAPDGGYGWVIVAACFVLQGMLDGCFSIVGVFLPELVDYFDGGRAQVAVIGSVMGGCVMLSGPFVSILVNCWGCRTVTIIGGVVMSTGMFLSAFAPNVQCIVITLGFVTGIGLGMQFLPSIVIVGFYFERRRAIATGIATAGSGAGVLLMSALAAFLLKHYDWKNALVLLTGVLLHSIVAGALFRPVSQSGHSRTADTEIGNDVTSTNRAPSSGKSTKPTVSHTLLKAAILNSKTAVSNTKSLANGDSSRGNGHQNGSGPYALANGSRLISSSESVDKYTPARENSAYKSSGHKPNKQPGLTVETDSNKHYYSNYEICDPSASASLLRHRSHHPQDIQNSPLIRRKDVFYTRSVTQLAEFRSQADMQHYISSVTIPVIKELEIDSQKRLCGCIPTQNLTTTKKMLDFALFTNYAMLVIAVSNALWQTGYMIPLIFISDYGMSKGMDAQVSSLVVGIFGVSMIFGRFLGGAIGNLPKINPIVVVLTAQILAGCASIAVPFCTGFYMLMFCIASIGFMLGPIIPLTSVLLVDYLGLNNLTNAVGLVSLSKGLLCFFGAPIAGALLDATGSYVAPFVFAGILYIVSGLLFALLPVVGKRI